MCGGFVVSLGVGASNARQAAIRQVVFSLGRVMAYGLLGATAGFCGSQFAAWRPTAAVGGATLSIVAGTVLLFSGLHGLGVSLPLSRWPGIPKTNPVVVAGCHAARLYRSWLTSRSWIDVLLAGAATSLLPCGLLYGYVTLAASTGDLVRGGAVMLLFGLGTAPLLSAIGLGAGAASVSFRQKLLRAAAVCVMLTGLLTVYRGVAAASAIWSNQESLGCPLCRKVEQNPAAATPGIPTPGVNPAQPNGADTSPPDKTPTSAPAASPARF
jgi:sulfite exporter TauE/SafE